MLQKCWIFLIQFFILIKIWLTWNHLRKFEENKTQKNHEKTIKSFFVWIKMAGVTHQNTQNNSTSIMGRDSRPGSLNSQSIWQKMGPGEQIDRILSDQLIIQISTVRWKIDWVIDQLKSPKMLAQKLKIHP